MDFRNKNTVPYIREDDSNKCFVMNRVDPNRRRSVDRFIPSRRNFNVDIANYNLQLESRCKNILATENVATGRAYRRLLDDIVKPHHTSDRILYPSLPVLENEFKWPVKRRTRKLCTTTEAVLDLPYFRNTLTCTLMDWGATDYITAALRESVFLWHTQTNRHLELAEISPDFFTAVKWNNTGDALALATSSGAIQIWTVQENKLEYLFECNCGSSARKCVVVCIAYPPLNNSGDFVTGCIRGTVTMFSPKQDQCLNVIFAHDGAVVALRFSPDGRYLASSGKDGIVRIWEWPGPTPLYEVDYLQTVRAISWHPWKPSYLCTSGRGNSGKIYIWNVKTQSMLAKQSTDSNIHAIEWSSCTGELVSSHWLRNKECSEIIVWSSMNEIVGKFEGHVGRVLYLMWSPDGKKLATAGADEALRIWNFVPSKNNTRLLPKSAIDLRYHIR